MFAISRKTVLVAAALPLVAAAILAVAYCGWRHEPAFYRAALVADADRQKRASNELLEQASALVNDVRRQGDWQALFTAEQVNGWLAVDLPKNHPNLLPPEIAEPRVALENGRIRIACRQGAGRFGSVMALEIEPYLVRSNELAVRICGARAGWVPLPLGPILKQVAQAALEADLPLRWDQAGGDPVAVITLSTRRSDRKILSVESLEVHAGELYLAGKTQAADWPSADPIPAADEMPPLLEARLPGDATTGTE